MSGLGQYVQFTPKYDGNLLIYWVNHAVESSTANLDEELCYGTGTPPINGAAPTGTHIPVPNSGFLELRPQTNSQLPVVFFANVLGLTIGQTYWFDAAIKTTSATGSIDDFMAIISEQNPLCSGNSMVFNSLQSHLQTT